MDGSAEQPVRKDLEVSPGVVDILSVSGDRRYDIVAEPDRFAEDRADDPVQRVAVGWIEGRHLDPSPVDLVVLERKLRQVDRVTLRCDQPAHGLGAAKAGVDLHPFGLEFVKIRTAVVRCGGTHAGLLLRSAVSDPVNGGGR